MFAHPTKYEAYAGLPALEAMALGIPVVALDVPGSTEAVEGVGIVVPSEDPVLLADALARLRDDSALRTDLGRARPVVRREPHVGVGGGRLCRRVQEGARARRRVLEKPDDPLVEQLEREARRDDFPAAGAQLFA